MTGKKILKKPDQFKTPDFFNPSVPTSLQPENSTFEDRLKLEISLLPAKPKTPSHDTEIIQEGTIPTVTEIIQEGTIPTLQTITEEFVQEDTIQPMLCNELDSELLQKIINDLREDPYLKDICTEIEQQVEHEMNIDLDITDEMAMDIDLDITEDYSLEKELQLL